VVGESDELSPVEAGRILKVSPATVRRYEGRGLLKPSRRLPGSGYRRYRRTEVEALAKAIEDGTVDA